jgi:hypothetical protein
MNQIEPVSSDESGADPTEALAHPERRRSSVSLAEIAQDHPGLLLAGGLAAGLALGALLPRKPVRKAARGTAHLAEFFGAAGLALGRQAIGLAASTGSVLRSRSETAAERAEEFGENAAEQLGRLGETVAERAEDLGEGAIEQLSRLGDAAREQVRRVIGPADGAATRLGNHIAEKAAEVKAKLTH